MRRAVRSGQSAYHARRESACQPLCRSRLSDGRLAASAPAHRAPFLPERELGALVARARAPSTMSRMVPSCCARARAFASRVFCDTVAPLRAPAPAAPRVAPLSLCPRITPRCDAACSSSLHRAFCPPRFFLEGRRAARRPPPAFATMRASIAERKDTPS